LSEKMVRLILVRHGESIANKKGIFQGQTYDTGLTARGQKQALFLARLLIKIGATKIIASHLKRARETAEIIARQLSLSVTIDDSIIEISHGRWESHTNEWVKSNYGDLLKLWRREPTRVQMPDGENLKQICKRVKSFLENVVKEYEGKTVIVVGHDLIMKVMIAIIIGLSLDNIWKFRVDNGSLTILELDQTARGRIIVLNQISHLGKYLSDIDSQAL